MNLEKKIPPPVVGLLTALLIWLTSLFTPALDFPEWLTYLLVGFFWLLSALIAAPSVVNMKKENTTLSPIKPEQASSLVTSGSFRITRNPMYLSLALILLAWTSYLASPAGILWIVFFIFYIQKFQILPEEKSLESLFGDDYRLYKTQVRRWV